MTSKRLECHVGLHITHLPANARSCRDLSDDKWTTIEDQTRSNHRCIGLALISFKEINVKKSNNYTIQ